MWDGLILRGTFLVTYLTAMVFCGIPVFYQEVAIGQYLGVGGMTLIGELAPIMKGHTSQHSFPPHLFWGLSVT